MGPATLKILKRVGESSFWRRAGHVHTWLYQRTGGKIGQKAGHISNLLLTTKGRKTGKLHTVPLAYMADGEDSVIVASNGGADRHPAWWLNLQQAPQAKVQIGTQSFDVLARLANAGERARLWPQLKAMNPFYASYEPYEMTGRRRHSRRPARVG